MISLPQLKSVGLSASGARDRVAAGKLHRMHRGVFAVGHTVVTWKGRQMAAVLRCGEGAVASHRAAGRLLGVWERPAGPEVTVPRRRIEVPEFAVHRTTRLEPDELTIVDSIPCTTFERTALDLAETEKPRAIEKLLDRAEQLRIFDLSALQRSLSRAQGRRGASMLAKLLGVSVELVLTRSEAEELLFAICASVGLPRPRVNMPIALGNGRYAVLDFAWPDRKLGVETDGWATHGTRRAFAADRWRDRQLALLRWRVLRYTWHEIEHTPDAVAAELGAHLALAS